MLVYTYLKILFLIVSHFATPTNDFTLLKRNMIFFPHRIAPRFKGSPFYAHCLSLSLPSVDKTWAEGMWNIYSALAQSTMAAHTLYLPWREILSVLPLPPTPPESLSPHWPELNTNYMSHCSAFTATLKPAAPVPHISPLIQTLFQLSWKQKNRTRMSRVATYAFDSLFLFLFVWGFLYCNWGLSDSFYCPWFHP